MFEVEECEAWTGHFTCFYATDGVLYFQFDNEQDAQEYCDEHNQRYCKCGDENPDHECCLT